MPTLPHQDGTQFLAWLQRNGLSEDQYWSKTLLEMIKMERESFVFSKLAKKISIPKKAGTKTWTTRRYLHLPVDLNKGKLAEGVAPAPMKVEGRTVSATVNQYGAYIALTDVAEAIHFDDIFSIYQPELARHAAETVERDLIAAVEAEASVRFAGDATSIDAVSATAGAGVADTIKFDDFRKAWLHMSNHFRKGHPSVGGKPIAVVHPNVLQDLLDDNDLIDLIIKPGYDEQPIKSGSLSQYVIYGIYFIETPILEPIVNSSGENVYRSFLIGADAFALLNLGGGDVSWYRKGFTADSGDPLGQKATLGYKLWTGGKVLDPFAVTVIYSSSTYDDEVADFTLDEMARPARQSATAGAYLGVLVAPTKTSYDVSDDGADGFDPTGGIFYFTDAYGNKVVIEDVENITFGNLVASQTSVTMSYDITNEDGTTVTQTGAVTDLTIVA
jgi:N4-gp56 family major capsid protein